MNDYQFWSLIITALLSITSIIVAGATSIIAYKQYMIYRDLEKNKFRFDLFRERREVYNAVKEMIRLITSDINDQSNMLQFTYLSNKAFEAKYLFDNEDIPKYIKELDTNGHDLFIANKILEYKTALDPAEVVKQTSKVQEIMNWISKQLPYAETLFIDELKVTESTK